MGGEFQNEDEADTKEVIGLSFFWKAAELMFLKNSKDKDLLLNMLSFK